MKIKNPNINQYLLLGKKLGLLLIILFVMDFTIGNILRYFYFKQDNGLLYRTTYSMEKTKADVLIFGSSRANHHYVPEVFEKGLGLTYYNVGRDGSYILYNYAMLRSVLKRYTPKIIILDIMKKEFMASPDSYDRLTSLLPYYKEHPEIRPIVDLKSKFEKYKLLSQIYPFNSSILTIAMGNSEINKKRENDRDGYIPLTREWTDSMKTDNEHDYSLDSVKVNAYSNFIQECQQSGTKLYIICSPYFIRENHPDKSLVLAKEIAAKNGIPFIDYSANPEFSDNHLFSDVDHLNNNGAIKFSELVVEQMKAINYPQTSIKEGTVLGQKQ